LQAALSSKRRFRKGESMGDVISMAGGASEAFVKMQKAYEVIKSVDQAQYETPKKPSRKTLKNRARRVNKQRRRGFLF
jgi:hypothetical protein